MTEASYWLKSRMAGAPEQLRDRMNRALAAIDRHESVPDDLARAAVQCLENSLSSEDRREQALLLLAADALLTHACEAAAEAGSDALAKFTATWNANRFESLLK